MAVDCKPQVFKKLVSKLEENLPGLVGTMNTLMSPRFRGYMFSVYGC